MLTDHQIEEIRQFNRRYTRVLGVLNKKVFDTDLTWPEGRILIEVGLNHIKNPMTLAKELKLDKSYASRTINKLVKRGILEKYSSPNDLRSVELKLTPYGQEVFNDINQRSNYLMKEVLATLNEEQQTEFLKSIESINRLLFGEETKKDVEG
ncbi:MarR family winged helix-turn-helix transcriptional regulator [Limosilactobacillus reuteri]|uniref:MarR family winged helix-turn-helix transcriptional regulator n=1 Tax=Limosilactobacillus reuteri TaxID=1598 RepID=UPI003D77DF39